MSFSSQTHGKAMSGCRVWQAWISHLKPSPHTHTGSHWGDWCDRLDSMPVYISQIDREVLRGSWIKLGDSMKGSETLKCALTFVSQLSLIHFLYNKERRTAEAIVITKKIHMLVISTLTWTASNTHRHSHAASFWYFPQTVYTLVSDYYTFISSRSIHLWNLIYVR